MGALFFQSFRGMLLPIAESPHFEFVIARQAVGDGRAAWLEYKKAQHGTSDEEMVGFAHQFNLMIHQLDVDNKDMRPILLKFLDGRLVIVDGAHRAAIWAALYSSKPLPALFLSE